MASAINDLVIPLRLSAAARAKLAERAAQSGQDAAAYVSGLVEQAVNRPTIDEILGPFRRQVAESGMTDDELDAFLRGLLTDVRLEQRASRA